MPFLFSYSTFKASPIALGPELIAAAEQRIDSPMEGCDATGLNELLDLKSKELRKQGVEIQSEKELKV